MAEGGLTARLAALADGDYRAFQAKLIPTLDPGKILGVRAPALRALAKETAGTAEALDFMSALPHRYYDEDNLHALYINAIRDYPRALRELRRFLPYVDNWATCDMLSPAQLQAPPRGTRGRGPALDFERRDLHGALRHRRADEVLSRRGLRARNARLGGRGLPGRLLRRHGRGLVLRDGP